VRVLRVVPEFECLRGPDGLAARSPTRTRPGSAIICGAGSTSSVFRSILPAAVQTAGAVTISAPQPLASKGAAHQLSRREAPEGGSDFGLAREGLKRRVTIGDLEVPRMAMDGITTGSQGVVARILVSSQWNEADCP